MNKIIYTFIFSILSFVYAQAQSSFIYKYKITFKQEQTIKTEEAKNWIRKLAHTEDIKTADDNKLVEFETLYKINELIFSGKMEKVNFSVATIKLLSQTGISDEAKDKLEKERQLKEKERIDAGKNK